VHRLSGDVRLPSGGPVGYDGYSRIDPGGAAAKSFILVLVIVPEASSAGMEVESGYGQPIKARGEFVAIDPNHSKHLKASVGQFVGCRNASENVVEFEEMMYRIVLCGSGNG